MEFLFVCYLIAFSIWNTLMYNKLSDIKDELSRIRRMFEAEGKEDAD